METRNKFNIRVYGIIINDKNEILLTDEYRMGMKMTKLPGGGLEYGEGTIDCLKREILEELNLCITEICHFYTMDYFQESMFYPGFQLISVYYLIDVDNPGLIKSTDVIFDFKELTDGAQTFRWKKLQDITEDDFTLPTDKYLAEKIRKISP